MNCSHCGSDNPAGGNFCGDCGGNARHTVRGRGGPTALRRDGRDGSGGTGRPRAGIERRVHRGNFQHEPDLTTVTVAPRLDTDKAIWVQPRAMRSRQ